MKKNILLIILLVPITAFTIGTLTRSAFTARLLLLIIWYGYLNAGAL